ncbi:MAG: hypothetical protein F6K16_32300 [Symploca sp. SIO2B6]|nr:hypothetical protein [Symploca sp. SIO2B6]
MDLPHEFSPSVPKPASLVPVAIARPKVGAKFRRQSRFELMWCLEST